MPNELDKLRGLFKVHESFASNEEYDASSCLSYSKLKDLHDNPEILTQEREVVEREWFTFGTLVDLLLTAPEDLDKKVFVNDFVPSEQYKAIVDYMVATGMGLKEIEGLKEQTDGWEQVVEDIYTKSGSAVNWKPETKRQKLIENCEEYIKLLTDHTGKLIVTTALYMEAVKVAEVLKTHPWTKDLFMSEAEQLANHIEILYQFKIKYIYEGLQCKSKLDILIVDHDQKIIIPYDIKTGNDLPRVFINHGLYKYKYGYQGCLYREGLDRFISKIEEFKGYEVLEFKFVYISRQKPTYPVILEMSESCHREIRDIGICNLIYDIAPLTYILAEAQYYIGIINEDKLPTMPYSFVFTNGVVISSGTEDFEGSGLVY